MRVQDMISGKKEECVLAAKKEGFDGDDYELTIEDCSYIAEAVLEKFGRMPTKAEWLDVLGPHAWIGDAHYLKGGEK